MIMLNDDTARAIQSYDSEIQNNFFAHANIKAVDSFTQRCLNRKITLSSFLGTLTGGGIGAGICQATSLSSHSFAYPLIVSLSAYGGLCIGGAISSIYCTYTTKKEAPKIEI
jgi:hypothetical protein